MIRRAILVTAAAAAIAAGTSGSSTLSSQPSATEREHTAAIAAEWRARGVTVSTTHRTPDGSYPDLVTDRHAWEVEWAAKWKEAPGQAVFYGLATNREPAILLLMRGEGDQVYYLRLLAVCAKLGIRLEVRRVD